MPNKAKNQKSNKITVQVSLAAYGFRGDSSLALTCVCRDESTGILKAKIDEIYGQAFNINGLGAACLAVLVLFLRSNVDTEGQS